MTYVFHIIIHQNEFLEVWEVDERAWRLLDSTILINFSVFWGRFNPFERFLSNFEAFWTKVCLTGRA